MVFAQGEMGFSRKRLYPHVKGTDFFGVDLPGLPVNFNPDPWRVTYFFLKIKPNAYEGAQILLNLFKKGT